jgi:hypothetical protein
VLLLFPLQGKDFVIYVIRFLSCIAAVCIGQRTAIITDFAGMKDRLEIVVSVQVLVHGNKSVC